MKALEVGKGREKGVGGGGRSGEEWGEETRRGEGARGRIAMVQFGIKDRKALVRKGWSRALRLACLSAGRSASSARPS